MPLIVNVEFHILQSGMYTILCGVECMVWNVLEEQEQYLGLLSQDVVFEFEFVVCIFFRISGYRKADCYYIDFHKIIICLFSSYTVILLLAGVRLLSLER